MVSKVRVLFVVALDRLSVVKVMYEESAMRGKIKWLVLAPIGISVSSTD